jgi:hypothetical protein
VIRQYTVQLESIVQVVVVVVANRGEETTVSTRLQEVIDKGKSLYAKKEEEERVSLEGSRLYASFSKPILPSTTLFKLRSSNVLRPASEEAGFPPPLYVVCNVYWCPGTYCFVVCVRVGKKGGG